MTPQPISNLLYKEINFNTIVINLHKSPTREIDIISRYHSKLQCHHSSITNNKCNICGAFIGHIGHESDPLLYYKHIMLLANSFTKAKDVYIISNRYFPPDFELPSGTMSTRAIKHFKYKRTYILFNKISTSKHNPSPKFHYVIHFTNNPDTIWESPLVLQRNLNYLELMDSNNLLFINPDINSFKFYSNRFTYYVSDSAINEYLDKTKMKDKLRYLKQL